MPEVQQLRENIQEGQKPETLLAVGSASALLISALHGVAAVAFVSLCPSAWLWWPPKGSKKQTVSGKVWVAKDTRAGGVVHRVRLTTSAGNASGPPRATREAAELDMQRLVGKPEQEQRAELKRIRSGGTAKQSISSLSGTPRR